jgi:hypothetical protein
MPFYTPPRSHTDRLGTLKAAQAADAADFAAGHRMLPDVVVSRLGIIAVYEPVVLAVAAAEARRSREVSEKDAKKDDLLLHIRDYWEGLKRRTRRKKHDASVLLFAGLPLSGDVPPIPNEVAMVNFAKQIFKGDADMVLAGFPAMANPTAAEVDAMRIAYENEQDDIAPADRDLDAALQAAADHVADVDDIIEDVRAEISHFNRKLDDPSIRRVLRRYGMKFASNPGEPPEDPADTGGGTTGGGTGGGTTPPA